MQVPLDPLTEAEEAELSDLLARSASVSVAHARGIFSAIACEPSLEDPSTWLPLILGKEVPDQATLRTVFALLQRDRYATSTCLELGEPFAPDPSDPVAVTQFCKGFVRVSQASEAWMKDQTATALVLPLAVLAGYLTVDALRALTPDLPADAAAWLESERVRLPEQLAEIYEHFEPLRNRPKTVVAPEKVGRNEPCPCGSGKKFKKCCGSSAL
jgi:uncharacterized protein